MKLRSLIRSSATALMALVVANAAQAVPLPNAASIELKSNVGPSFQITEINAFETGTGINKALQSNGGVATASSSDFGTNPGMANDGNTNGDFGASSTWHSAENGPGESLKITFSAPITLDSFQFFGRTDCCRERQDDFKLIVRDAANNILSSQQITGFGQVDGSSTSNFPPPPPPPPPPAPGTVAFIGGEIISAPQAEGCCAGGSLFNFNGGVGPITAPTVTDTEQVGLDSRNGDGVYNGVVNAPATFSLPDSAGFGVITGFQVMNSTNAQFDDRQTGQFRIEVSTDGGGVFTTVVDQILNTVPNADGAAPLAQEFLIAPIALNPIAEQNIIRITSVTAEGAGEVSLSEFRTIVLATAAVPEPATLSMLGLAAAAFGMRRRRVA